jgi:hypothetical protein
VLVRLDLLRVDSPVAIFLFDGHERHDVEPVLGEYKPILHGNLAGRFSCLDHLCVE